MIQKLLSRVLFGWVRLNRERIGSRQELDQIAKLAMALRERSALGIQHLGRSSWVCAKPLLSDWVVRFFNAQ